MTSVIRLPFNPARMLVAMALFAVAACLASGTAVAQPVPMVDRPLVLPEGQGMLGGQFSIGLNAGHEGKVLSLDSGLFTNRTSGLSVTYGLAKSIEGGVALPYSNVNLNNELVEAYNLAMTGWPLARDTSSSNHFGPIQVWARFLLLPWASVELALLVPIENLRANRVALRASLPLKWVVIPGRLAIRAQPDLILGIGRADMNRGSSLQTSFFIDAGLVFNITRDFYGEVALGYGRMISPDPSSVLRDWPTVPRPGPAGYLPICLSLGYSVSTTVDVTAGFTLGNLTPGADSHGPADSRKVTVGVSYRF